jgi:hypothetical protein
MEETLLSRQETTEESKLGTSTKPQRLLRTRLTTNHSISKVLEDPTTFKSGAPTQDGGNSSGMKVNLSPTSRTTRYLMLIIIEM